MNMRFLFSFACLIAIATMGSSAQPSSSETGENVSFSHTLFTAVRSCIESDKTMIPKEEMYALLDRLASDSKIVESGSDDQREKFVNLQRCIGHVLACSQAVGEIQELIGVIHTPMPAIPLCARPQSDLSGLLDASIRHDPKKLATVLSRAQIVRECLMKGGSLYIAYPKGGFEKRTFEQQNIYREALDRFPDRLFDVTLTEDVIPPDLIGATYLFRNSDRQLFIFSIKARQANDIQSQSEWGLWFGPVQDRAIAARVNEVFNYLSRAGGPDLRNAIDWD